MPALLNVTYTPNYIGNHRICFRTTQPSYCCYTDDSASVIGVPKTTVIELDEFETCLQDLPAQVGCEGSVVDGYIQPFCVDQGSDLNRVPFTATFAASPCTPYKVTCEESGIAEISVTEPGTGWLPGEVPTVTITDNSGYGFGATAEAVMVCDDSNICSVESITIIDAGQSYYLLNQIVVDISSPPSAGGELVVNGDFTTDLNGWSIYDPDGGGTAIWSPLYGGSAVWNPIDLFIGLYQDILTIGHTYTVNIDLSIVYNGSCDPFASSFAIFNIYAGTNVYGPLNFSGSQSFTFTITCAGNTNFRIECIDPEDCVLGMYCSYVSVVDVIEGLPATAEVTAVADCGTFTLPDCDGTANPTTYQLWGGELYAINVCAGGTGPEAFKYTVTPNPTYDDPAIPVSCCDCVKYDIINTELTGDPIEFYYTDCIDQTIKLSTIDPQDTIQICAVRSSIWVSNPSTNQYFEYILSETQDC